MPDSNEQGYQHPGFQGALSSHGSTMHIEWATDGTGAFPGFAVCKPIFFVN